MKIRDDNGTPVDATFSVEQREGVLTLTFESRGPQRNTQYQLGLDLLLRRLADHGAHITDVRVESQVTAALPVANRRVEADGYAYPLPLATIIDLVAFRRALGAAQGRTGRDPDATGGGNPTKRIEIDLAFPAATAVSVDVLSERLAGRSSTRQYWALCANPERYRIGEAVRDLEVDFWTTAGSKVVAGDRVAIWQTLGAGVHRGVVALGEVVGAPAMMMDAQNPYWVDAADATILVERVPVRYVSAPRLPLWLGDSGNKFLASFSVAKAHGGTVFRISAEEWSQLVSAAGGWQGISAVAQEVDSLLRPETVTGQGWRADPVARRIVERYAMDRAMAYYEARWPRVKDVSTRASFDLLCRNGDQELRVEVKGTTSDGGTILLTRNEVAHARDPAHQVALFVTSGIALDRTVDPPVATAGQDFVIEPWDITQTTLEPLTYECRIQATAK